MESRIPALGLMPYAMHDEDTQGRRFAEPPHPYRTEYQRDRDRVIHSKAFRRLENKSQVFDPNYSDHFRNRLTHTIEVSQITRTVSAVLGLNTDLCEVLALSHDIGHPPFSHEGERVLDEVMGRHGSGFEHNLHALRIVEYFEEKYAAFPGLNLSFEVREGIIKHSRDFDRDTQAYVDISEYRLGERPPLEAQLIDVADEVAYNSADLDDGYDSGLLSLRQIQAEVEIFRRCFQSVEREYSQVPEKLLVSETVREIINLLVTDLIGHTGRVLEERGVGSADDVRAQPGRLIGFSLEVASLNRELKSFLHRRLYNHPILMEARTRARRIVQELFEYYLDRPETLPESHYSRFEGLDPHRVICDYIAGMTDNYARLKHQEICS